MTFDAIMKDLSDRKFAPCYLLAGEEPFFIDEVTGFIEHHVLQEDEKDFNQLVFYGNETDMEQVIHAARQYPMMAGVPQVVILKEAQLMRIAKEGGQGSGWDHLAAYAENPQASTILVIACKKKFDKRLKVYKAMGKHGVVLDSAPLYEDKVPGWIRSYAASKGFQADERAVQMLLECVGADLGKLAGELNKLSVVMPDTERRITPEIVERHIGISKDYNVFELQKALFTKNVLKSNRIVNYFCSNPNSCPMVKVIAFLQPAFSKLLRYHYLSQRPSAEQASLLGVAPFFLREYAAAARLYPPRKLVQVIHELRHYDALSKGAEGTLSTSPNEMLKELVYIILH